MAGGFTAYATLVALLLSLLALGLVAYSGSASKSSVETLQEELARLSDQVSQVSQGLEQVSAGLEQVLRTLDSVEDRLASVEESASGLQERVSAVEQKVEGLGSRVEGVTEKVEELGRTLTSLEERVTAVEEALSTAGFPLEVSDALGRTAVIVEPPERIVSIAPSITEILFTIGAGDLVVGVDEYSNYPPEVVEKVEAGELEVVGGFSTVSIEKVVNLKPDLVVGTGGVQLKIIYTLSQLGVTALSLESETIGDVFSNILLLGKVTQRMEEAQRLVSELKEGLQGVFQKTYSLEEKPRVLFVVWVNPVFAAGGKSWVNDLINIAGGANVLGEVEEAWPMVGWETIVEADPEVIIFTQQAGGLANATQALEWLQAQPGGANLTAVVEGRVYMLQGELSDALQRPGVRVALAAEALARILHPDLYGLGALPNDLYLEDLGLAEQG